MDIGPKTVEMSSEGKNGTFGVPRLFRERVLHRLYLLRQGNSCHKYCAMKRQGLWIHTIEGVTFFGRNPNDGR